MARMIFFVCNDLKKWLNGMFLLLFSFAFWFGEEISIVPEIDIRPFGKGLVEI